jgi:hypothetical protein
MKKRTMTGLLAAFVAMVTAVVFVMTSRPSAYAKCDVLETRTEKDGCYKNVAIDTVDPSICAKIVENDLMTTGQPRDYCYFEIARQTQDETLCEKVSDQPDAIGWDNRNACYTVVAVLQKNISLCDKITHPQQKETCIRSVTP